MIVSTVLADNLPFGRFPDTSTEYALDDYAFTGDADKVTFYVASTLNQAVTVQVVGAEQNQPDILRDYDVGGSISVSDGSSATQRAALTVDLVQNWHEWYGLTITTGGTAPTAGALVARAVTRHPEALALEMNQLVMALQAQQQALMGIASQVAGHPVSVGAYR